MLARFHVPELDPHRGDVALPAGEAHHLTRVLRLGPGAEVAVFDGRGMQYLAEVTRVAREQVFVRLLQPLPGARGPRVALTLVQSILKPDSMDAVIRDATMVGVSAIQPVTSERTAVKAAGAARALARWRRIALASAKQCGQTRLPAISDPVTFGAWLHGGAAAGALLLVEPAVAPATGSLREIARAPAPDAAMLVVGPEGGWSRAERDAALEAGCVPLSLGPLTLRAESVPLVAAGALLALWDSLDPGGFAPPDPPSRT